MTTDETPADEMNMSTSSSPSLGRTAVGLAADSWNSKKGSRSAHDHLFMMRDLLPDSFRVGRIKLPGTVNVLNDPRFKVLA